MDASDSLMSQHSIHCHLETAAAKCQIKRLVLYQSKCLVLYQWLESFGIILWHKAFLGSVVDTSVTN